MGVLGSIFTDFDAIVLIAEHWRMMLYSPNNAKVIGTVFGPANIISLRLESDKSKIVET